MVVVLLALGVDVNWQGCDVTGQSTPSQKKKNKP